MNEEFRITVATNLEARRTEAELCVPAASDAPLAIVYEHPTGWVVDFLETSNRVPLDALVRGLASAREALQQYVNRRGDNPPAGLTAPGLSLWLMEKSDGTSMGHRMR